MSEPSYIIGIASIAPRVDYSQGNDWDNDLDTLNDIHKPQLDGIGYQDLMEKWMHADADNNAAVGKTIAWVNYMTNVNKTYGNFAARESEGFMCLNRQYTVNKSGEKLIAIEKAKALQRAQAQQTLISGAQGAILAYISQLIPGDPTSPIRGAIAATATMSFSALMAALIMSKNPVPQYFVGRSGGKAEFALTQERGAEADLHPPPWKR